MLQSSFHGTKISMVHAFLPHFLLFATTYVYLLHRKKVPKTNKIGWPIFPPFCPGGLVFLSHRLLLEFLLRGTENKPLSILPQPFCGLTILSCSSGMKDGLIHPILFPPCLMGDRRHLSLSLSQFCNALNCVRDDEECSDREKEERDHIWAAGHVWIRGLALSHCSQEGEGNSSYLAHSSFFPAAFMRRSEFMSVRGI